jgi:signal transduction histidine kinase
MDAGVAEWHKQLTGSPDYRLMAVEEATERRLLTRADDGVPRPSVLIIEDDVDMLRLLGGLLGGDYDILTARDGVAGLRLLIQRRPDLLVTDLMLPGASGFEVVQQLRENPDVRETPVLMLTARGGVDDRVEAQERGVDAFLTKPFRRAELLATVDRLLRSHAHRSLGAERREAEHTERLVSGLLRAVEPPLAALELQGACTAPIRATLARLALLATGDPPAVHEVDVAAAVERVCARLPVEAAGRVRVTVTPTPPVQAHPPWLEQVLFELIDNALRVAPAQTPVDVGIAEDGDSVRVTVEDRGPGVPRVARTRIVHPFYTTRFAEPSAGLGLTIGRSLARRIGGSLAMESGADDRSVFVLRLTPSPRPSPDPAGPPT